MARVGRRRSIRMLTEHAWKVCPRCRYPLDHLPDEGTCPECGEAYSDRSVGEAWGRTYPRRKS